MSMRYLVVPGRSHEDNKILPSFASAENHETFESAAKSALNHSKDRRLAMVTAVGAESKMPQDANRVVVFDGHLYLPFTQEEMEEFE